MGDFDDLGDLEGDQIQNKRHRRPDSEQKARRDLELASFYNDVKSVSVV